MRHISTVDKPKENAERLSSVQQREHSRTRKHSLTFATITFAGFAVLLFGLALIFFAHDHERAYIFLALGAGGIIGGIAGLVGAASRTRTVLSYGVIASGIMGITVGLNYLVDRYGPSPNQAHATLVIALSLVVILSGITGVLRGHSKGSIRRILSRVITVGIIASLGVVAMTVGMVYLVVLHSQGHASFLLAGGALCFIGGVAYSMFAHSRTGATLR